MTHRLAIIACTLALLVSTAGEAGAQEVKVPMLFRRVTDFTNTLTAAEIDELESSLARFEDTTSNQIAVVVLSTLGGESIEDFALRTAEVNGVGQKKRDNGVLLLIAKDDRQMRIEVGYGLEGVLPDGLCGQIIRREIVPHFREGNYAAGIRAGVEAIMRATQNEYKAEPEDVGTDISWLMPFLFLALFLFLASRNARRGHRLMRGGRLPVFYSGGWGGGGSSSSGSSFGGFSGGGGSFGGGGASGSW